MMGLAGIPDTGLLRVVGVYLQIGEEKRFATGLMTAAVRLDCHEYRVDLPQCFRVITF